MVLLLIWSELPRVYTRGIHLPKGRVQAALAPNLPALDIRYIV